MAGPTPSLPEITRDKGPDSLLHQPREIEMGILRYGLLWHGGNAYFAPILLIPSCFMDGTSFVVVCLDYSTIVSVLPASGLYPGVLRTAKYDIMNMALNRHKREREPASMLAWSTMGISYRHMQSPDVSTPIRPADAHEASASTCPLREPPSPVLGSSSRICIQGSSA